MNITAHIFRMLCCFALVMASLALHASRGSLHLDGILVIRGDASSSARVVVLPAEGAAYALNNVSGKFSLDLPLDGIYLVSFEREGLVTKQVYFDTTVPLEKRNEQASFPFKVTLNPVGRDGVHAYAGPVGIVHYQASIQDFDHRTDYTLVPGAPMTKRISSLKKRMDLRDSEGLPQGLVTSYRTHTLVEAPVEALTKEGAPAVQDPLLEMSGIEQRIPVQQQAVLAAAAVERPQDNEGMRDLRARSGAQEQATDHEQEARIWSGEELITERNHVITVVRIVERTGHLSEYRRVVHRHGLVVHFHDGVQIPEKVYREATGR